MTSMYPGVALVVGAGSGIGRGVAVSIASAGCNRVAVADKDAQGLETTKASISGLGLDEKCEVLVLVVDVLVEQDVSDMVRSVVDTWGRVDYMINSAGVLGNKKSTAQTLAEEFDLTNGVNYRGCWLCARAAILQMSSQEPLPSHDGRPGNRGSIVNVASQLGLVGRPGGAAYCASKAAVIGLTRADAIDCSKLNIRVNCVCPGLVETPMLGSLDPEQLARDVAVAPMNRKGTVQEIADVVLFLASSKATFVQGAAWVVDGGYTIN